MAARFLDLHDGDGTRVIVNTSFVTQVGPTYGNDFGDGIEVVFVSFGGNSLSQVTVPASKVGPVLKIMQESEKFIDVKAVSGDRLFLNADYVTHVLPTHGADFSDGADVSIFGTVVSVPASGVSAVLAAAGLPAPSR